MWFSVCDNSIIVWYKEHVKQKLSVKFTWSVCVFWRINYTRNMNFWRWRGRFSVKRRQDESINKRSTRPNICTVSLKQYHHICIINISFIFPVFKVSVGMKSVIKSYIMLSVSTVGQPKRLGSSLKCSLKNKKEPECPG